MQSVLTYSISNAYDKHTTCVFMDLHCGLPMVTLRPEVAGHEMAAILPQVT